MADSYVWRPSGIGPVSIAGFVFNSLYRADSPLIDLRLFKNRVVMVGNSAMFVFAIAFFGVLLLFSSYFQQL